MIIHGDCLEVLRTLDENSVDAVVTDPPYGWRFMGKAWDDADILIKSRQAKRPGEIYIGTDGVKRATRSDMSMAAGKYEQTLGANRNFQEWTEAWAVEAFRVLKPGGHALIFCGPRTYHRMASGVEDAGFEIRDQLQWLFGSGFPKSHNIGNGRGTALKPANEPIVLARKPLERGLTVAQNVLKWGTGAINVDAGRIGTTDELKEQSNPNIRKGRYNAGYDGRDHANYIPSTQGRWPANVLFDESAAAVLDEQSGTLKTGGAGLHGDEMSQGATTFGGKRKPRTTAGDSGGASRFFYVAKASKRERNAGLDVVNGETCTHPTVKPIKLMEYLIKLITPPGGVVLDPFMGSGSTGVAAKRLGFEFIGCEMNAEYCEIAKRRIS